MAIFKTRKSTYQLTETERILLNSLSTSNKDEAYIARNPKGNLTIYLDKPYKNDEGVWVCNNYSKGFPYPHLFGFVVDQPLKISELLDGQVNDDSEHFTPFINEEYWTISQRTEAGKPRLISKFVYTGTKTDMFNLTNDMCFPSRTACKSNYDRCDKFLNWIEEQHREATK